MVLLRLSDNKFISAERVQAIVKSGKKYTVFLDAIEIELSKKEFELLVRLLE